jgi:hypothetical protein
LVTLEHIRLPDGRQVSRISYLSSRPGAKIPQPQANAGIISYAAMRNFAKNFNMFLIFFGEIIKHPNFYFADNP